MDSPACQEYKAQMESLQEMIEQQKPLIATLQTDLAEKVRQVKLAESMSKAGKPSPELEVATKRAEEITAAKGITSPDARLAWEAVEEIASANTADMADIAVVKDLRDECLLDATMEVCEALNELNRVIADQILED